MTPERAFELAYQDAEDESLETLEAGAAIHDRMLEEHPELTRLCQWTIKGGFAYCPEHGRHLLKCQR